MPTKAHMALHAVTFFWAFVATSLALTLTGCDAMSGPGEADTAGMRTTPRLPLQAQHTASELKIELQTLRAQGGTASTAAPLYIGQLHAWEVRVSDARGMAVYPAKIFIAAGMPEHGHAMPTQPRVTQYLGDGRYKIEGMTFNMDGLWQIRVKLQADNIEAAFETSFELHY